MGGLRLREGKSFSQGHTASKGRLSAALGQPEPRLTGFSRGHVHPRILALPALRGLVLQHGTAGQGQALRWVLSCFMSLGQTQPLRMGSRGARGSGGDTPSLPTASSSHQPVPAWPPPDPHRQQCVLEHPPPPPPRDQSLLCNSEGCHLLRGAPRDGTLTLKAPVARPDLNPKFATSCDHGQIMEPI